MKLTESEIAAGKMEDATLGQAVEEFREAGYVCLEGVMPLPWIETVRLECNEAVSEFAKNGWDFEKHLGHAGMLAPVRFPFLDRQAVENPFALQILDATMGPDVYMTFYNTNTALPGSGIQGIHRDIGHLFPELPHALPVSTVVVNIALVDFTEETGSTEVWPGTHLIPDPPGSDRDTFARRAGRLPSRRTHMPAGSVVVRDMRMWHRGMPNRASYNRSMLAMVFNRPFIAPDRIMRIPRAVWNQLGPRSQHILRRNPIIEDDIEKTGDVADDKYSEAVRVVVQAGQASTSLLQRQLKIGYNRAAALIGLMEKHGIVGAQDGVRPREVLVSRNQ